MTQNCVNVFMCNHILNNCKIRFVPVVHTPRFTTAPRQQMLLYNFGIRNVLQLLKYHKDIANAKRKWQNK
jgi:hypothetical protein